MPHTAPVPNIVPIPGMDPGEAVAAGGAGSGGDDGNAGDGGDKEGAGGGKGGDDASGDNRDAPDPEKYPTCGTESHPVDVVTGRVFTHAITDLDLPGPLPLRFERSYSSKACREDQGLGFGWAHSFGWFVQVFRDRVRVWNQLGVSVSFPIPQIGHAVLGDWGWVVRREASGFAVDANDDVWRFFEVTFDEGKTYRLTAVQDRNKNRIALSYDAAGKLVQVTDSVGRIVKVTSTKEGRIASIEVKNAEHQGRWIAFARYQYDDKGRLVRVTDADDYSWMYEYDEFNRLVRDTNRVGLSFCFRYDAQDRGIEAWGEYVGKRDPSLADDLPKFLADGTTRAKGIYHRKLEYHQRGYTEVTDTTETRRYFGNRKGLLDKAVTGAAVTTSKYDDRGFETQKTDPIGATWKWTRDSRGRVLEIEDPLGRRTRFARDSYGLPLEVIDPMGGQSKAQRDQRGHVELFTDATGAMTQYTSDHRGLVTSVTNAVGALKRYAYDLQGNLVEIVQANAGAWTICYDALGRRISARDPTGAETRYTYTDRGDLLAIYDASGGVTRYTYDGERHLVQLISPAGHVTQFTWGGFHKLCARRDANGHLVRLAYSREGELLEVHNEREEIHRLEYDTAGRLIGETTFDGRGLRYRYDPAGRMVRSTNGAGETTTITYDAAGQIVGRELPDDSQEAFEYNGRGELIRATSEVGEFRFERDAMGRIVRETQLVSGDEHWVAIAYDLVGNRIGRGTSLGHGEKVGRDANGSRLTTWLDGSHRIDHTNDLLGREVGRTLPQGGAVESSFDAVGRLAQRLVRAPSAVQPAVAAGQPEWMGRRDDGVTASISYHYDADGELVGRQDRGGSTRYQYDPVGQLLAALPEKARSEMFRYDPAGNIHRVGAESEREYGPGNRLLRSGNKDYHWDDDGRLVSKVEHTSEGDRVWRYFWNGAGMLRRVETPGGEHVEFLYDPLARRVDKRIRTREDSDSIRDERKRFVWDGNRIAHEVEAGSTGAIAQQKTFVFEDESFAPLAYSADEEWFHSVNDGIGTPEAQCYADGRIAHYASRQAWSIAAAVTGEGSPIRFPGQYDDADVGLVYNHARYYDPDLARFISNDPIVLAGGLNSYAYAPNTFRWLDPFGLANASNTSGAAGAAALARQYPGGQPEVSMGQPIPGQPVRRVDRFYPRSNTAREAKSGRICMDSEIKSEIDRDAALVNQGVNVEWHFYRSPETGQIGPSPGVEAALRAASITPVVHSRTKT